MVVSRNSLLGKGLFPETLPPCFDSFDLIRSFRGIVGVLKDKQFQNKRSTSYIRYVGTKHDGNRRPYATPNPISYFSVSEFIAQNWKTFDRSFSAGEFGVSSPRPGSENEDRAVIIPPLSELADKLSSKIRYAPFILKTDIAQFFPSIYTHSIPWAAHGIDASKKDQNRISNKIRFNQLDWFCQQCQNGQTRGVLIGPDAFRIVAEYISSEIDLQLRERAGELIVGAVRHVDDFYVGVKSEVDATVVLSHLREILQNYELQINDSKTRIISGLEPIDDVWAQNLRAMPITPWGNKEQIVHILDSAYDISKRIGSESPMKLVIRKLDQTRSHSVIRLRDVESKLQRIIFHFPHCTDYICLLIAKRFAVGDKIDIDGWSSVASMLLTKHLKLNHHHEITWILWLVFVCKLPIERRIIEDLAKMQNSHVQALLIVGYVDGVCAADPKIRLGNGLGTTDEHWLRNLLARSLGYSKSHFSGALSAEFEHLASKHVRLIDFEKHMNSIAKKNTAAISRSKYGYDADGDDEIDDQLAALARISHTGLD